MINKKTYCWQKDPNNPFNELTQTVKQSKRYNHYQPGKLTQTAPETTCPECNHYQVISYLAPGSLLGCVNNKCSQYHMLNND